jgi:hypothetical protein
MDDKIEYVDMYKEPMYKDVTLDETMGFRDLLIKHEKEGE